MRFDSFVRYLFVGLNLSGLPGGLFNESVILSMLIDLKVLISYFTSKKYFACSHLIKDQKFSRQRCQMTVHFHRSIILANELSCIGAQIFRVSGRYKSRLLSRQCGYSGKQIFCLCLQYC